ncbi:sugar-phosphatase [Haloimpatiens sp. FM7330]|uniref:sugar-phosphatase n=1 Tax=Haloimpatiens sp. FM7330 TaxID=3298610 RepID=UPI003630409E
MFKLIALDMDGTLLKEDKTISNKTFEAIQNAKEKGVKVVLSTGRPVLGIKKYLQHLNLINEDDFAVTYNGAVVQCTKSGQVIADNPLTFEDLHYLYNLSKELGINIHALTTNTCITPKANKYSEYEATMNEIPLKVVDFDNIDENTKIVKVMFVDPEEILSKVIEKLPKDIYEKYTVVRSAPFFLEFLDKNVNKGFGVKLLAEKLNIKPEEVICVGDAGNDVHMIKYAGLGVAMDNASLDVKKQADYITLSNEEDGVAHVINKFILKDYI